MILKGGYLPDIRTFIAAYVTACAYIEECLENNYTPIWSCFSYNKVSVQLSIKSEPLLHSSLSYFAKGSFYIFYTFYHYYHSAISHKLAPIYSIKASLGMQSWQPLTPALTVISSYSTAVSST